VGFAGSGAFRRIRGLGEESVATVADHPALQVLEHEGEGVLSAHSDALGVGLLVAGVSQRLPGSCQVGSAHRQAGSGPRLAM
jgi:hypothetical protein